MFYIYYIERQRDIYICTVDGNLLKKLDFSGLMSNDTAAFFVPILLNYISLKM